MNAKMPQLEVVFNEALACVDVAQRAAYLDSACAGNAELRTRVEGLLAAHADRGAFLGGTDAVTAGFPEKVEIGRMVAERYKLLEVIGEGGMGTVYMAEQTTPVRRLVALKVIKPGMDSKAVLARFEAERQALALMDHPNIAKVLDAGATEDGLPFFVMDLVKGIPITKFCDERKLSPRERLELFVPVCQAIQHAHQKGVIHRDIKPSNVLVALYDGHPVPKVIDFGVAKAAGQPLTEMTLHTGFGAIVGTPEYMSPEQATFNQLDIDTRSDVYALGVLLYELLTGTTPVDKTRLKEAAILEVLRIVREEEPPRPSVKLTTADTRATIAASRGSEPDKLSKLLRGELDWIVMKALEKDRNRRYDTAAGLAKDVQRYLADEMVEARPPNFGYRLKRFVRKNTATLLVGWLVFCLLLGWFATARNSMYRLEEASNRALAAQLAAEKQKKEAEQQRDEAERQRQQAEQARLAAEGQKLRADGERFRAEKNEKAARAAAMQAQENADQAAAALRFMEVAFLTSKPDTPVRQAVAAGEARLSELLKGKPLVEAMLRRALGEVFAGWGEWAVAAGHSERAAELCRVGLGSDHPDTLFALNSAAYQNWEAGHLDRAVRLFEEQVSGHRRRGAAANQPLPNSGLMLGTALENLGACLLAAGRSPDAEPVLRERLTLLGPRPSVSPAGMKATSQLGSSLLGQKKYAEAEKVLLGFFEPNGLDEKFGPPLQPLVTEAVDLLVRLYGETNQPKKSAEWRKRRPLEP